MNKNLFILRTSDNNLIVINSDSLEIEKEHQVKKMGDIVLIENK